MSYSSNINYGVSSQEQADLFQAMSQEQLESLASQSMAEQMTAYGTADFQTPGFLQPGSQPLANQTLYQTEPASLDHSSMPSSPYLQASSHTMSGQTTVAPSHSPSTMHGQLSPEPFALEHPNPDLGGFSMPLESQAFTVMNVGAQTYASHSPVSQMTYQATTSSGNHRPGLSLQLPNFGSPYQSTYDPSSLNREPSTAVMPSPIVRIEPCPDPPETELGLSRNHSRRSISSRRSAQHLSPLGDEHSDEDPWPQPIGIDTVAGVSAAWNSHIDRSDDGAWISHGTGQGGISPVERAAMNNETIMSLDDQEKARLIAQKNAHVTSWLTHGTAEDGNDRSYQLGGRPRARSANDIHRSNPAALGFLSVPPGPGVMLNEASDFEEEDLSSFWSMYSGSDIVEPTSPAVEFATATQPIYYAPHGEASFDRPPFTDDSLPPAENAIQPASSNEAMMAFQKKAKEVDAASMVATIGSQRRNSEPDVQSLAETVTDMNVAQDGKKRGITGIVSNLIPSRNNSRKRKSSLGPGSNMNAVPELKAPVFGHRRSISGRPRTPKLDTTVTKATGDRSPNLVVAAHATLTKAMRGRSKSDIGKLPKSPGLTALLDKEGGLPAFNIGRTASRATRPSTSRGVKDNSDDEDGQIEGISMDLTPKMDMKVIPDVDGFRHQIQTLNPRIDRKILERLAAEQVKRFIRLNEAKRKHEADAPRGRCDAKKYCTASGGKAEFLPPKSTGKATENVPAVFQVVEPGKTERDYESLESSSIIAQFPVGIPLPPAEQLPAKFECTYCFTAKEFKKPSDWTKHIHEDVQPFTCTFPDCHDAKSFKRKADWVRHENERHRQLESFICDWPECTHVCHRRDNFVQHLVREHRVPEPKIRTGRVAAAARSPGRSPVTPQLDLDSLPHDFDPAEETIEDYVQRVVDRCRDESDKSPSSEPCRFCGNILPSWKKLTIHLAKHMEQISLPVIQLVQLHKVGAVGEALGNGNGGSLGYMGMSAMTMQNHLQHDPSVMYEEPADMDSLGNPLSNMIPGGAAQSFLPLGLDVATHQGYASSSSVGNAFLDPNSAYNLSLNQAGTSYPPAMIPGRSHSRASSFSDHGGNSNGFIGMRQGTTYPPTSYDARALQEQLCLEQDAAAAAAANGVVHGHAQQQSGPLQQLQHTQQQNQQLYGFSNYGGV